MRKLLLLNGPNLNMLGRRDSDLYGTFTLDEVVEVVQQRAAYFGYDVDHIQSNYEGELIEAIHQALDIYEGIIINAAAYTHSSIALLDALELCPFPVIEVHISDIYKREEFRRTSLIRPACSGHIAGLGIKSYYYAVDQLVELLSGEREPVFYGRSDQEYHRSQV